MSSLRMTVIGLLLVSASTQAWGAPALNWSVTGGLFDTRFHGNPQRSGVRGHNLFVSADRRQRRGLSLASTSSEIDYADRFTSGSDVQYFLSGFTTFNRDGIPGTFTGRLDYYQTEEETRFRVPVGGGNFAMQSSTDRSTTWALALSYMPYSRQFSGSMEYARSTREPAAAERVTVEQYKPGLGLGYNDLFDWIHAELIYASYSDSPTLAGYSEALAARLLWTHWFKLTGNSPDSITVGIQTGEALLTVDSYSGMVNTMPDILTGSVSLSTTWKFNDNSTCLLHAGRQEYKTIDGTARYQGRTIYMNLAYKW